MAKEVPITLTEEQLKSFMVRIALTDQQKQEINAATGLLPEAIEVPTRMVQGEKVRIVARHDLVCW